MFPHGLTPGHIQGIIFMTNKNHSKPLCEWHKVNNEKPFLKGRYEHPQHNNYLLLLVKNNITTFFNLLLSDQSIIHLLFIGKTTNKCIKFFCTLFAQFHTLTTVPSKAFFTLTVALDHKLKWNKMGWKNFGLEWHTNDQDSNKYYGYIAWPTEIVSQIIIKQLRNTTKQKYQNCAISPGLMWGSLGVDPQGNKC